MKMGRGFKRHFSAFLCLLFFAGIYTPDLKAQDRFRRMPPSPRPLINLNLPEIKSHELANGLKVSVIQNPQYSDIHLKLIIYSGESHSPDDLPGLATFTANMLSKGTRSFSSNEFEDMLAAIGGKYSISVYPEHSILTMSFLEEFLNTGLEMLGKLVIEPSFSQRELVNLKTSLYHNLAGKKFDPDYISRRLMMQILFRDHPYQKSLFNEDNIRNFKREHVRQYFQTYYRSNNARLALIGNIDLQTASRLVSRYLNTWKKTNLSYDSPSPPKPVKRLKVCLVDMPSSENTIIYLGNIINPYSPEDYFPYSVFSGVIGSTPNSRIFMNLRETKGYAYYAFSQFNIFQQFGIFFIRAKVRPEVALLSIEEILKELDKIIKIKIPSREIEQAKSYLLGNYPIRMEGKQFFATKVADILSYDLGETHWTNYYENIKQVDSNKVYELVKKSSLLTPVIVLVTNANLNADENPFMDKLTDRFGEVEIYNHKGILQYIRK